jgi:endonuclease G
MIKKYRFIILFLITILSISQTKKDINNQIYHHKGFSVSYNEKYEQPNWVKYTIKKSDLICQDKAVRVNKFIEDILVISGSGDNNDYKGSGYDRGHLKPAADESCDQIEKNETFIHSNISPQHPKLNRTIWKKLEKNVRDSVLLSDSVVVITGPNLTNIIDYIGENNIAVASKFYKVIKIYDKSGERICCYEIPNYNKKNDYKNISYNHLEYYSISLDDLIKSTNINFR